MPAVTCKVCGSPSFGSFDRLISPCSCSKKSDSHRVHLTCLEKLIQAHFDQSAGLDELESNASRPRCPRCGDAYRVRLNWRFQLSLHRLLTCRSICHAIEFLLILFMLAIAVYSILNFRAQSLSNPASSTPSQSSPDWIIYVLFGSVCLLIPITLKTVFGRWKMANSESKILEIV